MRGAVMRSNDLWRIGRLVPMILTSVGLTLCWLQSGCLSKQDEDESRQDGEMDTHGDATADLDVLIKDCYDCGVLAGSPQPPSFLLPSLFPLV